MQSGNDVWCQFVLDPGDLVLQRQLLLFQAPQLQLIGHAAFFQCVYGGVQISVFGAKDFKFHTKHLFGLHLFGVAHLCGSFFLGQVHGQFSVKRAA